MAAGEGDRRRRGGGIVTGRPRLCFAVLLAALVQHLALGARPPRRFWGACVRGGQDASLPPPPPPPPSNASGVAAAGAPAAPGLLVAPEPEQQHEQEKHAAGAIEPVVLTEEEQGVLALVSGAETPERVLGLVAKLPAVRGCPDFHLRIANAGRGDASVAAAALRRLGKLVGEATAGKGEGERAAIRARVAGDRRCEQLLECVACQAAALGPAEASNALFALAALRVEKEEGEELLGAILRAAATALANDLWVGLQPSETVTLAVSLAHVVAFLPPVPPAQLLPLLEALEGRLARDAPLLSSHDLSRLAGALAAMGRGSSSSTQQAPGRRPQKSGGLNHGPLLRLMGEIVRRHPQSFAPRDLAAVADALAQLGHGNATVRAGVAAACAGRIAELPPDDLATLARALGAWAGYGEQNQQQREAEEVLMLELLVCAEARRGDLGPSHTADLLWSFGRHDFRNATAFMLRELPGLFARADGRLPAGSPEAFSASDLAKVVWAYATLLPRPTGRARLPAATFVQAPAVEAGNATEAPAATGEEEVTALPPQPQQPQPEPVVEQPQQHLLSALAGRAAVLVRHTLAADPLGAVDPPLLVALAWALVTLGHRDAGFLEAVGEVMAPQLDALSLPEIARLAWALTEGAGTTTAGGPRTAFFDALALLVELHHPHFRLADLSLCLFALASRGYDGAGLRLFGSHHYQQQQQQQRLAGEGAASLAATFLRENELRALHPSDEAKLLWALARLRREEEPGDEAAAEVADAVIDAVCHDLRTKLATLSQQDLALTLDALAATAGSAASEDRAKLQAHLARQLPPWLEAFASPELAAVLHSLLALRQPPAEAGLAEAAHALVERRLRRLLDRAERAEVAGSGGAEEARGEDGEDDFFHLSRCQQLLGLWRRTGAAGAE